MLLDELVGVIETLKERIASHREVLSSNEYRTRVSLIDPLLCALGWDTADPNVVTLEYVVGGKKADYALLGSDGKPIVVLEAKSLDSALSENERMQMLNYANIDGVPFAGLTDGNRWEIYSVFDQKPLSERSMLKASVLQNPTPELSLQFLLLWRANMATGSPKTVTKPIVEVSPPHSQGPEPPTTTPPVGKPREGWTSLVDFEPIKKTKPPPIILFDNGEERGVKFWNRLAMEVAEYLIRIGKLTVEVCPVHSRFKDDYYLVNVKPEGRNGTLFYEHKTLSNGLYIDTWIGSVGSVPSCIGLLEHCGEDPAKVWLKTG